MRRLDGFSEASISGCGIVAATSLVSRSLCKTAVGPSFGVSVACIHAYLFVSFAPLNSLRAGAAVLDSGVSGECLKVSGLGASALRFP